MIELTCLFLGKCKRGRDVGMEQSSSFLEDIQRREPEGKTAARDNASTA